MTSSRRIGVQEWIVLNQGRVVSALLGKMSVTTVEVTYDSDSVILHIACSWYKLSISTFGIFLLGRSLPVRPDPTLRGMHACNAIYLSHRGQQAQHEFLMSLHRRPFLCRFISLFNSTRLLTPSSWISGCVRRQHTCTCTVQRMQKSRSQRIRVLWINGQANHSF